ncbi:TIR domain-containing adapter molecule 1 [Esox lucius]|uniref:TIR domain-containing protein n=1 Tax=Esox lucius TaxID=8010 RepID=A0A3P8XK75_ESOLU|nr:TIR domain-containing adapter molecule 1 [Esox lucius]
MTSEMDRKAHTEEEHHGGTGLVDVLKILTKVPYERKLSLNFTLGVSLAEEMVRAISLISLGKRSEALEKLQALGDNLIANYLAEKVRMCGVKLENLSTVSFQESNVDTLVDLARMFKVLAEERLCDQTLRDLAYQTALAACKNKNCVKERSKVEYLYMELSDEAKKVCGPQIEYTVKGTSPKDFSGLCSNQPLVEGRTILGFLDQTGSGQSLPSSLREDSTIYSYPSHLEISVSETIGLKPSNLPLQPPSPMSLEPVPSQNQGVLKYFSRVMSRDKSPTQNEPQPVKVEMDSEKSFAPSCENESVSEDMRVVSLSPGSSTPAHIKIGNPMSLNGHDKVCPTKNLVPPSNTSRPASHPTTLENSSTLGVPLTEQVSASAALIPPLLEEEEEDFFSFVVLHAQEDVAMAEMLTEKLEATGVGKGATFQEFAIPGKNLLMCVEDAINNSAFTILLLTSNFNSRLLEVEASSALMNAIQNRHKYNTVIPFLPRENCMPNEKMPSVLRIYIPLREDKTFEKKAKRAMTPAKIAMQRQLWLTEQAVRAEVKRRERLQMEEKRRGDLIRERQQVEMMRKHLSQQQVNELITPAGGHFAAQGLENQQFNLTNMRLQKNGWSHPQGNIRIENARYIMIGDNSAMTVGIGRDSSEEEDDDRC